jgi:fructose-bisphosphate aldolase, class II
MQTLRECINDAEAKQVAIGHFNISNLEGLWGIFRAAESLHLPVIIGVSEGERDFVGVRQTAALVKSIRDQFNYPIFLNADHTYSFEKVKEAVDAGFDSVIFDGAKLPLEDNIRETKRCVDYARSVSPEIIVEGEIGYIGSSSKILDEIPEGVKTDRANLTHPDDAERFVKETGVDMLAPAVGNIHGMFRGGSDPALDIELVKMIREASGVPLVLHGGSGNSADDFVKAIDAGVAIVHINTEIRIAFRDAVKLSLQEKPDEVAPYKIMSSAVKEIQKVVTKKLELFNKIKSA